MPPNVSGWQWNAFRLSSRQFAAFANMKKGMDKEKEKEKEKEFPCAFGYDAGPYHGQLFFYAQDT